MNIHEFCQESGLVLAELAGEKFTGQLIFTVDMRDGGLAKVEVSQRRQMGYRDSANREPARRSVGRADRPVSILE